MEVIRHHFTTIDSTNNWAKKNVDLLDPTKMTVITADEQTAGRGRFKRRWESPLKQNIYVSFCFFLNSRRVDIGNIPQIAAIAIVQTLNDLGFDALLKWPNDVMVSDKKIAGILCETTSHDQNLCVVVGVGVNVNMPLDILLSIDRPATSLFVERGVIFSVEEVLVKLLHHWGRNLEVFLSEGFSPFIETYRKRIWMEQEALIRFNDNLTIWEGSYHSIDDDGALNMKLENGEIKKFIVGEIL